MWYYLSIVLGLVFLDQLVKQLISATLPLCMPGACASIEVLPFFRLLVLHNTGAAFSFLHDAGGWQRWVLSLVSALVSGLVAAWLHRVHREQKLPAYALTFILGGAIGNLIDRTVHGYVVDYLVFHYQAWYFPAFNVADAAISVGAGLLLLDLWLQRKGAPSRA